MAWPGECMTRTLWEDCACRDRNLALPKNCIYALEMTNFHFDTKLADNCTSVFVTKTGNPEKKM